MFRNFFQRHPGVFPKEIQDFCIDMIELMARRIVSAFFMFHTLLSCFFTFILFSISRSPFFVYENVIRQKPAFEKKEKVLLSLGI